MTRSDPHSYADDTQPRTSSLRWKARVDFDAKVIHAEATLTFAAPGEGPLDLDTRDLDVASVVDAQGRALTFSLAPADPVLGARLRVELPTDTTAITVAYRTSPEATALQWLTPAQTSGKVHPFLFSQCQAIHARSVIPCQDSPRVRITFEASVTVPAALRCLVAAAFKGRTVEGDVAVERYAMPQPVPPYLFAFAVGDVAARDVGPRSRVWAEPAVVDAAAWEFAEIPAMLAAGESLFGPYDWDRFDVLVMPPSFLYGGMENPRLTFLTPTLLTGDRSQAHVVAHELAHSWTGNLVTNANAEHFWLNEGWTRYAELRIIEAIDGPEVGALHMALGVRGLERAIERFTKQGRPELTRLRTHLAGIDPDDAFSEVPYDKGCLFLMCIEEAAGKERFAMFIREYCDRFRFGAITTDDFLAFVEDRLPGVLARVDAPAWIDGPGIPPNAPTVRSSRLDAVLALRDALPSPELAKSFRPAEWQLYLERIPHPATWAFCQSLDAQYELSLSTNHEILVSWLELALASGYDRVIPRVERVLAEVGRMKYLKPLYQALTAREETRDVARRAFAAHAAEYHPIARGVIRQILQG